MNTLSSSSCIPHFWRMSYPTVRSSSLASTALPKHTIHVKHNSAFNCKLLCFSFSFSPLSFLYHCSHFARNVGQVLSSPCRHGREWRPPARLPDARMQLHAAHRGFPFRLFLAHRTCSRVGAGSCSLTSVARSAPVLGAAQEFRVGWALETEPAKSSLRHGGSRQFCPAGRRVAAVAPAALSLWCHFCQPLERGRPQPRSLPIRCATAHEPIGARRSLALVLIGPHHLILRNVIWYILYRLQVARLRGHTGAGR